MRHRLPPPHSRYCEAFRPTATRHDVTRSPRRRYRTIGDHVVATGPSSHAGLRTARQQVAGAVLVDAGAEADPERYYLVGNVEHMIWPYDDHGRLIREDVREVDESQRQVELLEPEQVLTSERTGQLLDPFIEPRPPRPF
ncbi:hypothetical protein [Streptomyces adustus]|uniref:hypothetical protein n=1 Tax=Streptomyces adustus TaxID=1609272 RepID=UPI003721F209